MAKLGHLALVAVGWTLAVTSLAIVDFGPVGTGAPVATAADGGTVAPASAQRSYRSNPARLASTPPTTATTYMPVIDVFACDPCAIDPGEPSTLRWDVTGAVWVTLDGRGVAAPGSMSVQPDQTTAYHLIAANENGRSEKTVSVEVRGLPVIRHFTCEPCEIRAGEPTTLSWDLTGGTAAYLDGEGVTAPGSAVFVPDSTTTYHLEAVGESGSVERLVTVRVIQTGDADAVAGALTGLGYRIRSVGRHQLASGGTSMAVVMASACAGPQACAETTTEQFEWGMKVLHENFPDSHLSIGVYDGWRYTTYVTLPAATASAYLRGDLDREALWGSGRWNVWDDWNGVWLPTDDLRFGDKDFSGPRLAR